MNEYLNQKLYIKIDRPMGSKHPKYDMIYPINYGYIPNTISGDDYTGTCIAIIKRLNDNDDKLIIVPDNYNLTNEEIDKEIDFVEKYFKHIIIRKEDLWK